MRIQLTTAVLAAAISAGCAFAAGQTQVDVYINAHDDSSLLIGSGTIIASAVYQRIGVRLNWHTGEPKVTSGSASNDSSRRVYKVRTVAQAPDSASAGALASTDEVGSSGTQITVYKDRILRLLNANPRLQYVAVGYVLAHELAHLMQGVLRHSESGILKARWSYDEYQEMCLRKLAFTQTDIELIHQRLAQSAARLSLPVNAESVTLAILSHAER
jgi:hypothetical protein